MFMRFTSSTLDIQIDLEPGIYTFYNDAATGKTRTWKELRQHQANGSPVATITYNDLLSGLTIKELLSKPHYDLIFADRYDMYASTEINKEINARRSDTVILVDYKSNVCAANPQIFSVKVLLSCFGPDRMIGRVPSCVCCRFRSAASGRIKRMSPALFDDGRSVRHPANADR